SSLYFNPASLDQWRVFSARDRHTTGGVVDAIYPSFPGQRCKLLNGPTATTTNIQDGKVLFNPDIRQAPILQAGMRIVHQPQKRPADHARRFANLIQHVKGAAS